MGAGLLSIGEIIEVLMEVFFIYRDKSKDSYSNNGPLKIKLENKSTNDMQPILISNQQQNI